MEVSYGESAIDIPKHAIQTEITTYMWPGFLGEFIHATMEFDVCQLVGPTRWVPRPDIVAPPRDCMGIETTKGWRWTCPCPSPSPCLLPQEEQWLAYPELALWRRLRPNNALYNTQIAPA